ncbi:MAG: hypothetical protein NT049_07235, partial [Planctomycetota bacterium]|nr:hypothetical protein [Planctomycetota bacterium]
FDELVQLMGPVNPKIPYKSPGPTVIMMAGLQGSGKTTTCGKLARLILAQGHRPLLVACDCHRPAAVEQLMVVGSQAGVPVYSEGLGDPVRIAKKGVKAAAEQNADVVIVDTAGRLHIDLAMMQEARDIAHAVQPDQVYLVCDAMTGQDAVTSAKEFNAALELSGVILTKLRQSPASRSSSSASARSSTGWKSFTRTAWPTAFLAWATSSAWWRRPMRPSAKKTPPRCRRSCERRSLASTISSARYARCERWGP